MKNPAVSLFSHRLNFRPVALAGLAALGMLLAHASWRAYDNAREEAIGAETNALRLAVSTAAYQQGLLDRTSQLLRVLGGITLTQQHDASTCSAFLARQLESFPEYDNLAFADEQGDVWCSARAQPDTIALPNRFVYSRQKPLLLTWSRQHLTFALPHIALDGHAQGAVIASLPVQALFPAKDISLPQAEYGLINAKSKLVAAYPARAAWDMDASFARTMLALDTGSVTRLDADGTARRYIAQAVPGASEELRLLMRLPDDGAGRLAPFTLLLALMLTWTTLTLMALRRLFAAHATEWRQKVTALRDKLRTRKTRSDTTLLRQSYAALQDAFAQKEERGQQLEQLDQLSQKLQSCVNTAELADVVARCAAALFPGSRGALFLRAAPDKAECALAWGGGTCAGPMHSNDCHALRLGQPYANQGGNAAACTHAQAAGNYVCMPLIARGATLGVLHLGHLREPAVDAMPWAAAAIAERAAIALTAVRRQERLQLRAMRDGLTGLFNRGFMDEALAIEQQRAVRRGSPIGVMMLDIDHFKRFNDTFGHAAGDALLRGIGALLRRTVREGDMPCRYGGEEFVVILPGADIHGTRQRAEALRAAIEQWRPQHEERALGAVSVSIGVAAFPLHGDTWQGVLKLADQALYAAKHAGRNRVAMPLDQAPQVSAAAPGQALIVEKAVQATENTEISPRSA